MKQRLCLYFVCLCVFLVGCVSASDWLRSPATTQPGSPTNEQVIQHVTGSVSAVAGPWGILIGTAVNAGLIVLHEYAARKRAASK